MNKLLGPLGQGISDFKMFDGQDGLAVAVSGGLDSMALVHLLVQYRKKMNQHAPIKAIHAPLDGLDPVKPLKEHLERIGVDLVLTPWETPKELTCSGCARAKKQGVFQVMEELGLSTVAYGHHSDDMIHTALMNLFMHSRLEGLHPVKEWFDGRFKVIRPMIYIPKKRLVPLARRLDFPCPPLPCPLEERSSRARFSQYFETIEKDFPASRANIFWGALSAMGYPVRKRQKRRPSI